MNLESERLRIRVATENEMRALIEKQTDDILRGAYQEMLQGCLDHPELWNWYAIWIIESKNSDHIGEFSFKGLNQDGSVEIGYGIKEKYRDMGYATEAIKEAVKWALSQSGIIRVEAETETENLPSLKVLEKCGFIPMGVIGDEGPRYMIQKDRKEGSYE